MGSHVGSVCALSWLVVVLALMLYTVGCSAATLRTDSSERKPWLEGREAAASDAYLGELYRRLNALNEAQEAALMANKRGFDFGLGRGFSGSQAAKHKMGLLAAAFPSGPGRRRRDVTADLAN